MAFRVELTKRASRDLKRIYRIISAADAAEARIWFNGLETLVLSLANHPSRGTQTPEDENLRHLIYGRRRHRYRIIYALDEGRSVVTVLHIRHGMRDAFDTRVPEDQD